MVDVWVICTGLMSFLFGICLVEVLFLRASIGRNNQIQMLPLQLHELEQKVKVLGNRLERLEQKRRGGGNPF